MAAIVALWEKPQCLTLEMSKGVNTHETLNTAMKKTAVFHYTEWKNREEGAGRGELGKYTDWPRTGCFKTMSNFLEPPPPTHL